MSSPQKNWTIWWGNLCPNCFKRFHQLCRQEDEGNRLLVEGVFHRIQVVNCSRNSLSFLCRFVHCSIITGRRGYGKNCLLYGLGRGSSLLFLTLSLVRIFSICSVTLICPLHRQLHDRIRCLTSCEGRSCRHWETGWSARFSSKLNSNHSLIIGTFLFFDLSFHTGRW